MHVNGVDGQQTLPADVVVIAMGPWTDIGELYRWPRADVEPHVLNRHMAVSWPFVSGRLKIKAASTMAAET